VKGVDKTKLLSMNGDLKNRNKALWTALLLAVIIALAALWIPTTPDHLEELIDVSTNFLGHVSEGGHQAGLKFVFDEISDDVYEAATELSILAKGEYEDFISSLDPGAARSLKNLIQSLWKI